MKIYHLLNIFCGSNDDALVQQRTLQSLQHAHRLATSFHIDVHYIFIGNDADLEFTKRLLADLDFSCSHTLMRQTTRDVSYSFLHGRNNPTLTDTFFSPQVKNRIKQSWEALDSHEPLIIISNTDICTRPHAYLGIKCIHEAHPHASFVINRETLDPSLIKEPLHHAFSARGSKHPGHDFFCICASQYSNIDLIEGGHIVGFGFVMRPVLANLIFDDTPFFEIQDSRLTFHYGDDMPWKNEKWNDAIQFNKSNMLAIYKKLYSLKYHQLTDNKKELLDLFFPSTLVGMN